LGEEKKKKQQRRRLSTCCSAARRDDRRPRTDRRHLALWAPPTRWTTCYRAPIIDKAHRVVHTPSHTHPHTHRAYLWLPALLAALCYATFCARSPGAAAALSLLALSPLLPPPPRWRAFEQSPLFDCWRRRHALRVVLPSSPPVTDPRTLFAHFPHGVFPMGCLLTMALSSEEAVTGVPAEMAGCVASALLRVPLVGAFFAFIGCHPAGKATLMRLLGRGSVGLIVEGIAGVHLAARPAIQAGAEEAVFLAARSGFIRAAIQAGVPVVPTYHFGTNRVFSLIAPPGAASLSRALRAAIMVPVGVWGWAPIPRACPLTVAVGSPLRWPQEDEPAEATVAAAHAQFVASLVQLFEDHKHLGGVKGELKVV